MNEKRVVKEKNNISLHPLIRSILKQIKMLKKLQKKISYLLMILILLSFVQAKAQTIIASAVAENDVHFAKQNFEVGKLTVSLALPAGTTGTVEVTLGNGIEYVPNSLVKENGTLTIAHNTSSPVTKPVFTLTGSGNIVFSIKRKVTKNASATLFSNQNTFKDTVKVTLSSGVSDQKEATYTPVIPVIVVTPSELAHDNASGTSVKTFTLKNTGEGGTKDIYFSVKYPTGITGVEIKGPDGSVLSPVGNVPTGIGNNTGVALYKITSTSPAGFKKDDTAVITEKYTVTGCQANREIKYEAYWGESKDILYDVRTGARSINVLTGTPNIVLDIDYNNSNFNWADGLTGNTIGTFTAQYINKGTGNATAYDLQMNITPYLTVKGFKNHKPANFRIVATDGTEIPISSMTPTGNQTVERNIPFKDLPELAATALVGKNIGLTDVDGDGFYDDLAKDAKLKIRFEMVKNQEITCLQDDGGTFSVSPHSNFTYIDACGVQKNPPSQDLTNNTFRRLLTGISDNSKFPGSLLQGERTFGYLSFGQHTIISQHIKEGFGRVSTLGTRKLKYEIKLPPGVEMKNVKFLRSEGYGQNVVSTTNLPDVAKGQTFSYTTIDGNKGYVTFELLLTTPCISGTVPLEYKITYLDKNGDTATYSEIPLICKTIQVGTICPGTCAGNGPVMLKTKVERADNSYGWTDYTMNTRQTRANVSPIDRSRALHLDEVEFISEGEQGGVSTHNLYYHAQVKALATLIPKQITLKVGNNPIATLPASTATVTQGTNSDGKFFRWNLSSALPAQGIAVGEKFSVVATYQVNNSNSNNSRDNVQDTQVGGASFFYMLADPNDTQLHSAGYHTHELHCGAKQTPAFYIAETYTLIGTNTYNIKGCEVTDIGANQAYLARRFGTAGTYYTNEFRPSHHIKTLKIIIPKSYNMVRPVDYSYLRDSSQWMENVLQIPITDFQVTDNGTYKTYTYTNPAKGSAGYLQPGNISVENVYGETIRTWLQATCESKVFASVAQATADQQLAKVEIDFEDFYYHYADKPTIPVVKNPYEEVLRYTDKPAINLLTQTPQSITANKREQHINFQITNTSLSDAPYGWVSVPDVVGINVLGLEEVNASGNTLRTFSAATGISGEKMFFLDSDGQSGTIAKGAVKYYRLKYEITNCTKTNITFDLYAGWNCNSNPTQGHIKTCHDKKVTYNVKIAKSLKQITPSTSNPGGGIGLGNISMCQKTKYEYTINSGDEGDIFDVKLVIIKQRGLTISDVEIEYPLGSGTKFSNITPVENNNKITYDLTSIFPGGSLPGSISESNVNKRNFKLIFMVKPDCEFTAGSSFDIDIDGNNLCGDPAEGDRSKAIIAGIQGVDVNKYKVNNSLTLEPGGNANACASPSYATYKGKHIIVDTSTPVGTFSTGDKGLVVIRIPKGFEYVANSFTVGNKSKTTFADPSLPTNPIAQVGDQESELSIKIPQGMKNADFFEYTIKIKQKDNTPATECSQEAKIKYYTTDKVDGVSCPGGPTNPCPTITIETTQHRGEVEIPVERAKVKIENVQLASVVENNKEKVTFTYTLKNESTTFAYTGDLKISLFLDTNNNQLIEQGTDTFLQDFTVPSLSLASAATVQKTHTVELDQNQVCRLLLSIRNDKNYCLCNNLAVITSAPTALTDLVSDMTLCENEQKVLSYNTQAPTYENYTWEAVTPGALSYLSDSHVKEPVFRYTGASLTAQQTFIYKLTIKRTNGCEASQQVQVTVKPATATPSAPSTHTFCQGATIASLKDYIDNTVTGTIRVYADNTTTTALADNVALTATTYYYSAEESGRCESNRASFIVGIQNIATPTVAPARTECPTSISTLFDMATLVTPASGYTFKWYDAATGGTALAASPKVDRYVTAKTITTKYVSQEKDGCQSARVPVTYIVDDTQVPTLTINDIVLDCSATNFDTLVTNWLATAVATDTCGTPVITNNYVKPADLCGTGEITVIFTAKDGFNNQTQKTAKIRFVVAKDDDYTATPVKTSSSDQVVKNNGGTPYNILTNDKLYGNGATISNVTIVEVTPNTYVKIDTATGQVKVKANTPVGTYTVTYRICDRNTPAACSNTATVKVKVTPSIDAVDDGEKSVPATGGEVEVLGNDTLNGNPATKDNVIVSIDDPNGLPGLTINEGKIVVPNGSTPGTYTVRYKICDNANPGVCDTAVVKITVTGTPPPTIVANDDPDTSVAKGGEVDILSNDRLNGNPVVPTDVEITIPDNGGLTGLDPDPSTGKLKVPANATPGTYTVTYKICDKTNPGVCDTAVVKITVTGTPPPTIVANDDPDTSVAKGGTVDILSNDRLNGNPVVPTDVEITIPDNGGLIGLDPDPSTGKLKVPANATPGTYTVTYKICDKTNPGVCDTAKAKITVTPDATPSRAIKAVDDDFGKVPNTVDYTTTNTVFSTGVDTLEGVPGILSPETDVILHKGAVTRQDGTAIQVGTITMNDNGSITVKQGTPIGVYTYTYSICEKAVPTNCSEEAKATFEVVDNTILAKDDEFEVGTSGGLTPSILINDILKGKVGLTTDDVEIQDTENKARADNHLVIEGDGRVTVKPGIVARPEPYLYYYTIKEKANPANTSNAVIKIKVVSFTAVDDEDEVINEGTKEKKIPSVLRNDDIDGKRPEPGKNVIFTPSKVKDKDGNEVPGIVINQEDGSIAIAPNTPDGVYTYSYKICKKTVPNECKTAKGILKLLPALVAGDDLDFKPVNVTKGAVNVGNILANDLYAGEKVLDHLDKVTVTLNGNDGSGAYIDEQGNLIVPQGAPVKEYEFTYDLCIKGHPGACKTAKIKVEVIKDKPLTIYNGVSADGDGHNDYFKIDGIEYYPKNNLKIFNRWGVLVYEKDGYSNEAPFDGHSNGRATISADSKLPQGTYYYILEYEDSDDQPHTEKGWLYLKY